MSDAHGLYPPTPEHVPPGLTTPTPGYRARVLLVLLSLILFLGLYAGLVAGSAWLCYWSFAGPATRESAAANPSGELRSLVADSNRLLVVFQQAADEAGRGQMGADQFVQTVQRDVLPPWRAAQTRLSRIEGVPADLQPAVTDLTRYLRLREENWDLLCQAITRDDEHLAQQAHGKAEEANRLADKGFTLGPRHDRGTYDGAGVWRIVGGVLAGVLCLFLVKGLVKRGGSKNDVRLEVREADQPLLFAFIRRLCRDTGAALPHRVYLTADVNAAVSYHESVLSLFLPTRKNLIIGLGLVNQLNLSEFKAVLAHEFGHFSQQTMKVGRYVYTANRVIGEFVFGRDWLDDIVDGLRGVDIRIAVFAWALTGVLWMTRKTLERTFRAINFANAALSRQMEFNADLVAVSVTGSDALINALGRLDVAAQALGQAWQDLDAAADRQLYSQDVFYHQARAGELLRAQRAAAGPGVPPLPPTDLGPSGQVFQPEDLSVPKMWASHPTNYDREVNAKRQHVPGPTDDRSPWDLFRDASSLRERMTRLLYEHAGRPGGVRLESPAAVQSSIDAEHAETTYSPHYRGLYDQRYLSPVALDGLIAAPPAEFADAQSLADARQALYGEELKARMDRHRERREEHGKLTRLACGELEAADQGFQFRGARYRAAEARRLLELVRGELEQDNAWMAELDRRVFQVHYAMARQLGGTPPQELEARYRFQLALQGIHDTLTTHVGRVHATVTALQGQRQIPREAYDSALGVLREAHRGLSGVLEIAGSLRLPALTNVTEGDPLSPLLLDPAEVRRAGHTAPALDGMAIAALLEGLGQAATRASRVHAKSLGAILALQETIARRWQESQGGAAAPGSGPSK